MNAIVMAFLGAGIAAGLLLVHRALRPRPAALADVLGTLARPGRPLTAATSDRVVDVDRLGWAARRFVEALGYRADRHRQELELVDRTAERHALGKVAGLIAGAIAPLLIGLALATVGVAVPMLPLVVFTVGSAVGGFVLPDALLRDAAEKRRRAFRHALSSYLDLVNVLLAGGAGIETALHAAADAGDGWGYQTLRAELRRARLTGRSPWGTFAQLDERLGITELGELAASVSLAGSHGARIRASLAAKADTLRGHQVAETEAAAEAATERMTVPVAVLLFGFLVFIAYPAVVQITSVGGPHP
jgi:Flp pilus assembly protein TadB